ncbi:MULTISPECIES: CCA tRNA nucleotidyltransferase [Pseudanabaena]|uniref:Polynucleotide adenylyltransferase region n=2 Tax=Pseudanabaena TaxID=1152 RepID=L8N1H9_9CYAN|nr:MULTISPECIES: CCA tRNA nucleotidyltransferase [Pseudanabaena]ELS33571.1 Polynucleotide adenylyltransferase region [Pseudanabaena biceps PCC 7429]MDG3494220.1 CCA tRNA nucleotidyltransferase [Pseudanabaena catenata USMAC16]
MQQFPFDFNDLPTPTYLVGGWVRDRLLNRQSKYLDLDFVLPEKAVETAQAIARKYKAGFVVLDAERQIARVVFKNGTADFAQQMGRSIEADLGRRDFCMNAIALECHQISQNNDQNNDQNISASTNAQDFLSESSYHFIDPLNGIRDLQEQKIRMVAPENLAEDPLRILRGYRQAAQLGFAIEGLTRQVLIKFAPKLKSIAAERVRTELGYLLSTQNGNQWMLEAISDRILEDWLPSQHLNLARFTQIGGVIRDLLAKFPHLDLFFSKQLAGDRYALVTIELAALTNSATALEPLGLSRAEQRWLVGILRYLPQFMTLVSQATRTAQYKFFQATLEFFPAIAALALASGCDLESIAPWLERWLNPHDAIAYPVALISGDDLRNELGIPPSPKIGELLESVKIAQVEGKIQSKQEAIDLIQSIM